MINHSASKSRSFGGGFGKFSLRGFFPLLTVILLAAPEWTLAQENLAVTVNPRSLDIMEGGSGTYTVVLDAAPPGAVTIQVRVPSDDVTVDPLSLQFASEDWNTPQTVTVTVVEDADAVDEIVTLTHWVSDPDSGDPDSGDPDACGGDPDQDPDTCDGDLKPILNTSVTVTVEDNDTRGVTLSTGELTVDEAASNTYTIRLETQPTATVTVDIGGVSGELTVSPSRLFFTPENYNVDQTVTVYAAEDFDADGDTSTLTHTIQGGDYTGVSATPPTVSVTTTDNDMRGVEVSPTSLNIAAGSTATYTVGLKTRPTRTVNISVAEETDNEGVRVSPSRLSFSPSRWNRPQTVTARTDSDATGSVNVVHAVSSEDTGYDELTDLTVSVTVSDAQPGIRLSPSSLSVDEGARRSYTVRLASAPTGNETVTLGVPNGSDLSLSESSLTFDQNNWSTAQTVTVTADEDEDAVPDTVMVTHKFGGVTTTNSTLRVTIRENDTRGVTVTPTSLEVTEGSSGTYTAVLDSKPTDTVTVTISGASGDVTLTQSQLTFTTDTWFTAQEVVVNAADDADGEPDAAVTLRHTVRGGDYDRQRVDNVRVTIRENDTRGITVDTTPSDPETRSSTLMIAEGGTGSYTVKLDARPTGAVTVMVRGASGDVTVDPSRLIFTASNYGEEQTVEVKVAQDADGEDDAAVTLTHAASGGGYNGVTGGMVTVTTTDNDPKGVTITPRALTVTEGMPASAYSIVLHTEPTGTVTITLGGLTDAREQSLMVSPSSLTFTQRNWNVPRDVTVRAAEDDDGSGGSVTLTHTVNGGGYASVTAQAVTVHIRDNDSAGLTATPDRLEIAQGSRRTYTVALNTKPTADVTVTITGGGDVTASPGTLKFTPGNWFTARTVTVYVPLTATATTSTLQHSATSSDTSYSGEMASVTVAVLDNDSPGVAVNPNKLSITEGGSASYTMVLTKAPTATVYVEISGAAGVFVYGTRSRRREREQRLEESLAPTPAGPEVGEDRDNL